MTKEHDALSWPRLRTFRVDDLQDAMAGGVDISGVQIAALRLHKLRRDNAFPGTFTGELPKIVVDFIADQ